ncbi:MAG: SFCGS family glycine-rich protein [bacterium]
MSKRPVVVIGHRMGKGQRIAKGVEDAGGTAIVIPGMLADMKLGDVMHENGADLGLSFCGSGGAGAITAATKYGYKYKQYQKTNAAAMQCIREGCTVIGFPFMDNEDLGESVVKAWNEMHGEQK